MVNILGIITAIVLAVSAFVALKNNGRMEIEIEERKDRQAVLKQTQGELSDAQKILEALPVERAGIEEQDEAKKIEEARLKEEVETLKSQIDVKTAEIAKNKAELEGGGDDPENPKLNLEQIKSMLPKFKENRALVEKLSQELGNVEAMLANLTASNTATQAEAERRKGDLDLLSKGRSLPTLRTSIRSIYPTWGFVTLNDGDNAGVATSSTLDVVRDGQTISRLLVTGVEARIATASIIPESKNPDIVLMVGDRVVPSENGKIEASN